MTSEIAESAVENMRNDVEHWTRLRTTQEVLAMRTRLVRRHKHLSEGGDPGEGDDNWTPGRVELSNGQIFQVLDPVSVIEVVALQIRLMDEVLAERLADDPRWELVTDVDSDGEEVTA